MTYSIKLKDWTLFVKVRDCLDPKEIYFRTVKDQQGGQGIHMFHHMEGIESVLALVETGRWGPEPGTSLTQEELEYRPHSTGSQ